MIVSKLKNSYGNGVDGGYGNIRNSEKYEYGDGSGCSKKYNSRYRGNSSDNYSNPLRQSNGYGTGGQYSDGGGYGDGYGYGYNGGSGYGYGSTDPLLQLYVTKREYVLATLES